MTLRNGTGPPLKKHLRRFGSQGRKKNNLEEAMIEARFFFCNCKKIPINSPITRWKKSTEMKKVAAVAG